MAPEIGIKIGVDGASQASQQLAGVNQALAKLGSASDAARNALAAVGLGVSVAGFTAWIKGAIDAADALNDISDRTGLATREIAGLQLAFQLGDVSADALASTMAKLSRSVVENADAFAQIGVSTKNVDGTFKSTRQILGDVADKFAGYSDGVEKAALAQELFGKSGAELIPLLNAGAAGLAEMDEMAEKLGLTLDENTAKQAAKFNDTLDLIGAGAKGIATRVAADLLPTLSGLAEEFFNSATKGDNLKRIAEGLGMALKALYVTGRAVVEVFSAVGKTIGAAGAITASMLTGDFKGAAAIARELKSDLQAGFTSTLEDISRAWNTTGSAAVEALSVTQRGAKTTAPVIRELGKAAKETGDEFAAQRDAAKEWAKAWEDFNKIGREASASADGLSKGQARLVEFLQSPAYTQASDAMRELALQEAYAAIAAEQNAEAQKAAQKAIDDRIKALEGSADAAEKALADLERENAAAEIAAAQNISLAQAIEQLTLARLGEQRAILAADPARAAELAAIDREIAARRALYDAIGKRDSREAIAKSADDTAKEFAKTSENIERSLTDALMRGFESGKGFGKNLVDTLKNSFKTLVLQPTISAVMKPIAGAAAGMFGSSYAAAKDGSGFDVLSSAGSLTGLFGAGGLSGSLMAGAGWLTGATTLGGSLTAATSLIGTGTLAGFTSGVGMLAGALGPIALGLAAVVSLLGKGGGPKSGGSSVITSTGGLSIDPTSDNGRLYTPNSADADLRMMTDQAVAAIRETATRLGGAIGEFTLGLGYDTAPDGKASSRISSFLSTAVGDVLRNINLDFGTDAAALKAGLATEVQRLILAGLQTATLPAQIDDIFDSIDAASATQEQIDSVFQAANAMRTLLTAAEGLNVPLEKVSASMIEAAGGVAGLTQGLATYYENFYSTSEQTARATEAMQAQFERLGLTMPTTREAFRSLVESLDLTAESGQSQYGALMALSGAFASLVPATEAAQDAVMQMAESARTLTETERVDLYELVGLGDLARSIQRDALDRQLVAAGFEGTPRDLAALQGMVMRANPEQEAVLKELAGDIIDLFVEPIAAGVEDAALTLAQALEQVRNPVRSIEQIAQSINSLEQQGAQLNVDLLRSQGRTSEADAAQRTLDTAGMTAAETALYDYNTRLREQIAELQKAAAAEQALAAERDRIANQRAGLERQLLELQGNTAALRALDRAAIDASNLSIYDQITALQDASDAAAKAAEGERALATERDRIASQRAGLERQLLELQGDQVALRALDRAAIDASNRDLFDQISALQDSAAAAQAAQESERALAATRDQAATQRAALERQELELLGKTTELRALDRAAVAESNRDIYDRIIALQDSAAATRAAEESERTLAAERDRIANQRASLERELLELQGDTVALRALDRAAIDESNLAVYDQIVALKDAAAAGGAAAGTVETLAQALERLGSTVRSVEDVARSIIALQADAARLAVELLDAQGRVQEAAAARRELDTTGMTEAEIALYDANAATRAQIEALRETTQAAAADADERYRLETRLLELQGDTAALRERAIAQMSVENQEIQRRIWALEDQAAAEAAAREQQAEAERAAEQAAQAAASAAAAREQEARRIADERAGLERQLLALQGNTAALRELERESISAANRELYDRINALRDEQETANRIATQRSALERQLLELQGDSAAIRAIERAEIDSANLALYDRVAALRDEQRAAESAKRIADERSGLELQLLQALGDTEALRQRELDALDPANRALQQRIWAIHDEAAAAAEATAEAERLSSAWSSATDSIRAEVERLRGGSGADSFASLQARFAVATAQARAGDIAAAQSLASLSRLLVDAGVAQSNSALEAVSLQARIAASLEETASVLEAPGTLTAPAQDTAGVEPITTELAGLREDQRAQASSMAALTARVARLLERWDQDGLPEERAVA